MSELCRGEHGAHPFGRMCRLLDSARRDGAHQPILSELSPAGPNTAVFRNTLTFRDLRWSCGVTVHLVLPLTEGEYRGAACAGAETRTVMLGHS